MDLETLAVAKQFTRETALGQGAVQIPGPAGKSAYQIAVDNGFVGTQAQWLASLNGQPGNPGAPGADGTDGTDGVNGEGVPSGGTTGQVLAKKSNADFDTQWVTPSSGGGSGGGYEPPQGGIPLTDLAQDVQDSLELADTALQEETDPVYTTDKPNIAFKTDLPESLTELANDGQDPFVTESELDAAIDGEAQARQADIETVNDDISAINDLIPNQASDQNQLADKDFVNSSVANIAAHFVSYDTTGNPFPTNAALVGATTFYYRGASYTPTEHDYTTVINDETHSGEQWRYGYDGAQWFAQYKVNPTPFTSAQQGAIDSNITQTLTTKLDELPDNATLTTNLNAKADKVSSPTSGNFAGLDAQGNLTDSGNKAADFATAAQGTKADNALPKTGGVLTGPLTVNSIYGPTTIFTNVDMDMQRITNMNNPSGPQDAATKQYVDTLVGSQPNSGFKISMPMNNYTYNIWTFGTLDIWNTSCFEIVAANEGGGGPPQNHGIFKALVQISSLNNNGTPYFSINKIAEYTGTASGSCFAFINTSGQFGIYWYSVPGNTLDATIRRVNGINISPVLTQSNSPPPNLVENVLLNTI